MCEGISMKMKNHYKQRFFSPINNSLMALACAFTATWTQEVKFRNITMHYSRQQTFLLYKQIHIDSNRSFFVDMFFQFSLLSINTPKTFVKYDIYSRQPSVWSSSYIHFNYTEVFIYEAYVTCFSNIRKQSVCIQPVWYNVKKCKS